MQTTVPLACFLSMIRPPGIQFENSLLQITPVNKGKCPFVRDTIDVAFQLYTRHNPIQSHKLVIDDDEQLFSSSMDFNDITVFDFHAFMETPDDGSALMIRQAFLQRGDTNVIMVDAQSLEAGPWYLTAAENTWYIGRTAARFIDYLVSRGLDLSRTHLVGHSLGAHSAGVAGSSIRSGRIARITGLDPALPLFNKLPVQQRLDPKDAEFVDVVHTDAGIFGYNQQVGHADFYPNGGISPQPGCELEVTVPQHQLLNKCDSKIQRNLNGTLVFNLKKNAHPSKKGVHTKINIPKIIRLARSLNTIRNIVATLKNMAEKKNFKTGTNLENLDFFFKIPTKIGKNSNTNHRQRRFTSFFKRQSSDNMIYKILDFLWRHHKKVVPVITVIREISTLIKTGDGELNNYIKEQNNYIGGTNTSPVLNPVSYNINVGNESKAKSILRKLFGLKQENLSISTDSG